MECPYCKREIDVAPLMIEETRDSGFFDQYFEDDVCACPECGKHFMRRTYYNMVVDSYRVAPLEDE